MTGAGRNKATFKTFALVFGVVLIYLIPFITLSGADDIFLKVGDIKGESRDEEFENWIDSTLCRHGVTVPLSPNGLPSGAALLSSLEVRKQVDRATPAIFQELVMNKDSTVELQFVRSIGSRQRFYRVKLHNAFVAGMSFFGADSIDEKVTFWFDKKEVTYTEYNSKGLPGREITAWYDLIIKETGIDVVDPSNTAPVISSIPATTTDEDTPVTVNFTVSDAQTSAENLAVSALSSSNPALVPLPNISFGGNGENRSATITPAPDQYGSSTIVFRVSDGSLTATTSFVLTVNPVNDVPTISAIPGQATALNLPISVSFQVNDVDNAPGSLQLSAQSSNPSVVPNGNIVFEGGGTDRSAMITPVGTGETAITITVSDGSLSANSVFVVSVSDPVPQAPTDILLSNNSVLENSTNGTLVGILSVVDADSVTHTFELLDSADSRFRLDGAELRVENGALLDFEMAESHSVLVKATDDDGFEFSKALLVQVLNVNEAPVFLVDDASTIETVTGHDTPITRLQLADPDAGVNELTLTLQVVNGILTVSTNFNGTITSNGTAHVTLSGSLTNLNQLLASTNGLIYRATANASGTDLLTVIANDNGHSGIGEANEVYTTLGIYFFRNVYSQWLSDNFTEEELNNAELEETLWGANADPDGDGLVNLVEYAIGTPPREPNSGPGAVLVEKDGHNYLSLAIRRRKDPALQLAVEAAGEVADGSWSSDASVLEQFEPVDLDDAFEEVRFDDRVPTSEAARRFLRMRWSLELE